MEKDIKIAIITDDKIDYMYAEQEEIYHSSLLSDYIKNRYPSLESSKNIKFDNANSMALFLREQGDIIFLNDTTYHNGIPDNHGKTGILIIPDEMNLEKRQLLEEFNHQLINYDALQIWYDFESHDECKMLFTKSKEQVETIVGYLLSKYGKTK